MTFQPGHNLATGRPKGSRNKRTEEIFTRLEERGDTDPADLLSSIVTNEQEAKELRIQAAGLLMPYKYSKCGTAPVQVYIDVPIECPTFERISDAETFLARVAALVAAGQLDIQAGQNLSALATAWLNAQYLREELQIKQINAGAGDHEQIIRIEGGLPQLPGTNINMPTLEHGANGHSLLTAPAPQISSSPGKESIADQGQGPSTNGGELA
jgi:hypothetical protein